MATSSGRAHRGVSIASGILALLVIIASGLLLGQALSYRYELESIFGYQIPSFGNSNYNNYNSYDYNNRYSSSNILGYDVDARIGISAGGIVAGILQFFACFLLCCARRTLSIGWAILQILILLVVIVCFALGIYFEVYSKPSNYSAISAGVAVGSSIGLGAYNNHPGFRNSNNYGRNYNNNNNFVQNRGGFQQGNIYDSSVSNSGRYGSSGVNDDDTVCNPAGQAYVAVLGLDLLFLIVALIVVGITGRRGKGKGQDNYVKDDKVKHAMDSGQGAKTNANGA